MKIKKILKRLTNYFKTTDKKYTSDFDISDIECDVLMGTCPYTDTEIPIKNTLDHIIILFKYSDSMIKDRDEFIDKCYQSNINIYCCSNTGNVKLLYIAGNTHSITRAIDIVQNDTSDNVFANICNTEINSYLDNRDSYEEPSFEFIKPNHSSIKKDALKCNCDLEILGYSDIKSIDHLNCIWLSVSDEILYEFDYMPHVCYRYSYQNSILKLSLSDFIYAFNESDANSRLSDSTISTIYRILKTDTKYYKYLSDKLSKPNSDDDITTIDDNDEEEDELIISQEEFFNSIVDEIIKG